jgi:hypothetical protein
MSGEVAPVEVLREVETNRVALEKMLKEAQKTKEDIGVSYENAQTYINYLKTQEQSLNAIVKQIEPLGGGRLRQSALVGKYFLKVAGISMAFSLLWDSVDYAITGNEKKQEDMVPRAMQKAFWDVFPSPMYGMDPGKFLVSPVLPSLEHAMNYGKFSGRGLATDITSYGLNMLPFLGLIDRATGKKMAKGIVNLVVPPKEKQTPSGIKAAPIGKQTGKTKIGGKSIGSNTPDYLGMLANSRG